MALACCECSRSLRVNAEVYCWAMLPSVGYVIEHKCLRPLGFSALNPPVPKAHALTILDPVYPGLPSFH